MRLSMLPLLMADPTLALPVRVALDALSRAKNVRDEDAAKERAAQALMWTYKLDWDDALELVDLRHPFTFQMVVPAAA